jgi:uncharacterized OB-fold protein
LPLIASRCLICGHIAYPAESICSACAHRGKAEQVELGPEGTLYTFTVVYAGAPGVETPYALGYVDFHGGARVFGRIVSAESLAVGMRMRVVTGPDSDAFWFEPVGESGENT